MRIGFDISQTGDHKAGCGYFAQSLIQALTGLDKENEYVLYPTFGTGFWDAQHEGTTWRTAQSNVHRGPEGMSHTECIAFWQRNNAALEPALGKPDVIHANNYYCPCRLRARIVYTLYDLVALDFPDYTTEANRLVCTDGLLNASVYADALIAISDSTRTRFLELFPHYPASRVHTVYPASRFTPGQRLHELPAPLKPGKFWLAVGTVEPRKNLRRLVRAYATMVREHLDTLPLVIAGGKGWLEDGFNQFITELNIANRVHQLGYVDDGLLASLYTHCFAFVYPSLVEGFGLPVLEAMGFGAPVVTSNRSSLAEIASDAALTVDPEDEGSLTAGLRQVAIDSALRARLRDAGRARAANFSWPATARAVLDLYREVLERPSFADEVDASTPPVQSAGAGL